MADPSFLAPNGQFDKQRFDALLRQAGLTEQRFVFEQRREALRRQLAGTVIGPPMAPKAMVEAADRYHNEQRTIDYVVPYEKRVLVSMNTGAPEVLHAGRWQRFARAINIQAGSAALRGSLSSMIDGP